VKLKKEVEEELRREMLEEERKNDPELKEADIRL